MKTNTVLLRDELLKRYDTVDAFREGLARVRKCNQWFHIRPDGSPAYGERYDFVGDFKEGLTQAKKGDEWFYIRPDGTRVD